jgi:hypothetical protein
MEQRVVLANKLQRLDPDALAQRQIERRGSLDPSAADIEVGVGVPDEEVGLDALVQPPPPARPDASTPLALKQAGSEKLTYGSYTISSRMVR